MPHGEEIDLGTAHVIHHLMNFEPLFTQPQHDARLGEDGRIVPLDGLQKLERGIIARAGADCRVEPGHGLEVVVVNVRTGGDDGLDSRFHPPAKIGSEDFDGRRRRCGPQCIDHLDELPCPAIGEVITVN